VTHSVGVDFAVRVAVIEPVFVGVCVGEGVEEGVGVGVSLLLGVMLGVALIEGVMLGVSEIVGENETVGVMLGVSEMLGVSLAVRVGLTVALGVIELVGESLPVCVGLTVALGVMLPDCEAVGVTEPVALGVGENMQLPTFDAAATGEGDAPSGCEPTAIDHVRPKLPVPPLAPSTTTVYVPAAGKAMRMCDARNASTSGDVTTLAGQGVGVGLTFHAAYVKAAAQPFPVPDASQAESSLSCTAASVERVEPSSMPRTQPGRSVSTVSKFVLASHVETSSATAFAGTVSEKSTSGEPAEPNQSAPPGAVEPVAEPELPARAVIGSAVVQPAPP
jgi:hypothetical protein